MFNIILYKFNKKVNSTKRPTITGVSLQCAIKDVDSILTPVIEISGNPEIDNTIPHYNYAFIPSFRRYYFIDDISYSIGTWSLSMHVDVLSTYQTEIMNSTQYVVRSASEFDLTIPDTMYMTKKYSYGLEFERINYTGSLGNPNRVQGRYVGIPGITFDVEYFNQPIENGCFVVGIVGSNTTGVDYYMFTNAGFQEFINEAMTFEPSNMTDVSSGLANAVFNPLQYITSVRWFPNEPYYDDDLQPKLTKIAIGGYSIPLVGNFTYGGRKCNISVMTEYRIGLSIPRHPRADELPYLDLSPYRQLNLVFQPFGCIPLDTTKLLNTDGIVVSLIVDMYSGNAIMNVYRSYGTLWNTDGLLYTMSTDYGVQLPISSLILDWKAGLGLSALSWLKDITSGGGSESFSSTVTHKSVRGLENMPDPSTMTGRINPNAQENINVLDKAMDLGAAALGQLSTVGSVGSFLAFQQEPPYVMGWFRNIVDEDPDRFGRPLYKQKKLSTLKGFVICMNANVSYSQWNPTADEQSAVNNALNSGVYLE